jgi:hypothetical protein
MEIKINNSSFLVVEKFRKAIRSDVSDDVVTKIVEWCYDSLNYDIDYLLSEQIEISHGVVHLLEEPNDNCISVHTKDKITTTWVFDSDGENIAT